MGVMSRWVIAVAGSLACFGGCFGGLAAERLLDTGSQVGLASVPLVVVLTVTGAWAERARERKPAPNALEEHVSAEVKDSPHSQAIGQVGGAPLIFGPGTSLTNPVFNLGHNKRHARESLRDRLTVSDRVLVIGDIPQEPAAFQPRAGLMKTLEQNTGGPRVAVVFAVTGVRGVGKTQVAAAHARRRIGERWRLVAWLDASDEGSVVAGLAQVAVAAGIGTLSDDARELATRVRHWLEADGERRLVVFDDAKDLAGLRPFLPAGGAAQVVITSTRRPTAGLGVPVPVGVFSGDEAVAFLTERAELDDNAGARKLATELGCLPLGLAQAAALIARERLEYGVYLERLRSVPLAEYLGRVEGDAYPYRTAEAIVLSLQAVEDADPSGGCATVMGLMAVLSDAGVSRRLLHAVAPTVLGQENDDARVTIDAVTGQLADASLVGFSVDRLVVSAHRLVMRVTRERLATNSALVNVAVPLVTALSELIGDTKPVWADGDWIQELVRQVLALHEHIGRYLGAPSEGAGWDLLQLRRHAVALLAARGDHSTGWVIAAHEKVASDCGKVLGPDHPDTLTSRDNLAAAYAKAGLTNRAIPLHEQTLADRQRVLGPDHPDTLTSRDNLAAASAKAGLTRKAIRLHEQTLADRQRVLGPDHRDTLASRDNLAAAYGVAGLTKKAIPLHEQTLADRQRVLGPDHRDTLASRDNLAGAYLAAGLAGKAISMYEQTLADSERALGPDHRDTLISRLNLATAYRAVGLSRKAIPMYEQILADSERILGPNHPDTFFTRITLAAAYVRARRPRKALPLIKQSFADFDRSYVPDSSMSFIRGRARPLPLRVTVPFLRKRYRPNVKSDSGGLGSS